MSKEKQIEEMARDICRVKHNCNDVCNPISTCMALKYSQRAFEAGYRKQSEGEWLIPTSGEPWNGNSFGLCSRCGKVDNGFIKKAHNFCPNCGARMSGGKNE